MKKRFFICFVCLVCLLTMSAFAAAPVILSQPQNYYFPADVELPATASFSILASGDGELSYQWQSNYGSGWTNLSTGTSATFSSNVSDLAVNGQRLFRCIVSNDDGSTVSDVVSISVGAYVMDSLDQMLAWTSEVGVSIFDWVGQACTKIVSEPLLLFTVGFLALGGAIGIVSRLLSRS